MKSLKKMIALVIALVMVLGMTNMAWAENVPENVQQPKLIYQDKGETVKEVFITAGQVVDVDANAPTLTDANQYVSYWMYNGTRIATFNAGTTDVTVTPNWVNKLTLTYDPNGVTPTNQVPVDSQKYVPGDVATVSGTQLQNADNVFKGWGKTGSSTEPVTQVTMEGDTTLFAIWNPLYTIHYDVNGGTGTYDDVKKENGESYTIDVANPTAPAHKSFVGWEKDGAVVTSFPVTGNVTLIAKYDDLHTVSFDVDGSTDAVPAAQTDKATGTVITLPSLNSTKTTGSGDSAVTYNFRGWKDGDTVYGGGTDYTITKDVTLVANWVPQNTDQNGVTRHEEPDGTVTYIDNTDPDHPIITTDNPNVYEITNGEYDDNGDPVTDSPIDVTVNSHEHAQYKAIQIFSGTQVVGNLTDKPSAPVTMSGDNNPMGNIQWGSGVNTEALQKAVIANVREAFSLQTEDLPDTATAQQVAEAIAYKKSGEDTGVQAFDDSRVKALAKLLSQTLKDSPATTVTSQGRNQVDPGYYLIVDTTPFTESTDGQDADAMNASLLQMTRDITITKKTDAPQVDKKILEAEGKVEANTAFIGEKVNYEISSKVPDHTYYDHYYFVMNDKLSDGLTFDKSSLKVWTQVGEGDETLMPESKYYVYDKTNASETQLNGKTFLVAFENIKEFTPGTKIFVRYSATLNEKAAVNDGANANTNEVTLTYSREPDQSGRGEHEQNDQDSLKGVPSSKDNHPTGETKEEFTVTYSTAIKLIKKGGSAEGPALEGAEFTLTGTRVDSVFKNEEYYEVDNTDGTYYKLANDTYTTDAPILEDYMESIGTGAKAGWVVVAEGEEIPAGIKTITVAGVNYREYITGFEDADEQAAEDAKEKFQLHENNVEDYADVTNKYAKKTATTNTSQETPVKMVATTNADGLIIFEGLAAGTYTLEETVVPEGYNKADNITITITGSINGTDMNSTEITITDKNQACVWTADNGDFTFTPDVDSLAVESKKIDAFVTTIIDATGSMLPETGGIGTTLFYIGGAILVLAAGILLVSKRRMA